MNELTLIPNIVLIAPVAAFVTAVISGAVGMGGGLILMAVFLNFFPVEQAVALHAVAVLTSLFSRVTILHDHISGKLSIKYLLGALVAALVCYFFFRTPSKALVYFFLGTMPLAMLLLQRGVNLSINRKGQAAAAGFINTCISLFAGIAVGFIDAFFVKTPLNRFQVMATRSSMQAITAIIKIVFFGSAAFVNSESAVGLLLLAPGVAIAAYAGTLTGNSMLSLMSDGFFKKATISLIVISSMFMLYSGLDEISAI